MTCHWDVEVNSWRRRKRHQLQDFRATTITRVAAGRDERSRSEEITLAVREVPKRADTFRKKQKNSVKKGAKKTTTLKCVLQQKPQVKYRLLHVLSMLYFSTAALHQGGFGLLISSVRVLLDSPQSVKKSRQNKTNLHVRRIRSSKLVELLFVSLRGPCAQCHLTLDPWLLGLSPARPLGAGDASVENGVVDGWMLRFMGWQPLTSSHYWELPCSTTSLPTVCSGHRHCLKSMFDVTVTIHFLPIWFFHNLFFYEDLSQI